MPVEAIWANVDTHLHIRVGVSKQLGCGISGTVSGTDQVERVSILASWAGGCIDTVVGGIDEGVLGALSHTLIVYNIKSVVDVVVGRARCRAGPV